MVETDRTSPPCWLLNTLGIRHHRCGRRMPQSKLAEKGKYIPTPNAGRWLATAARIFILRETDSLPLAVPLPTTATGDIPEGSGTPHT
mmetsp:Transcript_19963/g.29453  ORF Transcript_19963/g.29453 Transcript_19963/m.29453 type:complete len:88 (-) Transcript_19963:286-549(-)